MENGRQHLIPLAALAALVGALVLHALLTSPVPAQAAPTGTIRYVAVYGSDDSDCTNGGDPCRTVQYALSRADPGDALWIAKGSYAGTMVVNKSIALEGGYSSGGWIWVRLSCDPSSTVLDGLGAGRVVNVSSGVAITINCLTIANGNGIGDGGGLYAQDPERVVVSNVVISNNVARGGGDTRGGGVYVRGGPFHMSNAEVVSNAATFGGGLYLSSADNFVIQGSTIVNNRGYEAGGGLYVYDAALVLTDTQLMRNTAAQAGGLYLSYGHHSLIQGSKFVYNTATQSTGGAFVSSSEGVEIASTSFLTNSAGSSGGLLLSHSPSSTIRNCLFSGNQANDEGGAIWMFQNIGSQILSSTISSNDADHGAGLYVKDSDVRLYNNFIYSNTISFMGSGAGIRASGGTLRMAHNTLAGLVEGHSSGEGLYLSDGAVAWLTNTILVDHPWGILVESGCTATLEATLWGTGTWANGYDWGGSGTIVTGTVNIWADPDFVDPAHGDLHIDSASAAVDAGVDAGVTADFDGDLRPIGPAPEIGADEVRRSYVYLPMVLRDR